MTMEYVGFWKRVAATSLDGLIFLLVALLFLWCISLSLQACFIATIFNFIFTPWFYIYLVKKYEGTPGKRLSKIKIVKRNGDRITYREAIIRSSLTLIPLFVNNIVDVNTILHTSNAEFDSMSFTQRFDYFDDDNGGASSLTDNLITWLSLVGGAISWIYFIGCFFVPFNPEKRALHDYIANTVVVKSS